jgi:hypothetical protein
MGGPCEAPMTASTSEEMMGKGMAHLEIAHPEMAASVKAMPKDDPKMLEWNEKFTSDWAAAPESN